LASGTPPSVVRRLFETEDAEAVDRQRAEHRLTQGHGAGFRKPAQHTVVEEAIGAPTGMRERRE